MHMKEYKMSQNVHHIPIVPDRLLRWDRKFMTDFGDMILKCESCVQWVRINIKQLKHNKCTRSSGCGGNACLTLPASLGQLTIRVYDVTTVGGHSNALLFPETRSMCVCVKHQSNSTQVESVRNNDLIYACASFSEGVKNTTEGTPKYELAHVHAQLCRACLCLCVRLRLNTRVCPWDDADLVLHLPKRSRQNPPIRAALHHNFDAHVWRKSSVTVRNVLFTNHY